MSYDSNNIDISYLKSCIKSLTDCYKDYTETQDPKIKEYIEDACVKRFEFSLEISWKIMKRFLKLRYAKTDQELTMNNIFRFMENYDFIPSWKSWQNYYSKRNNTAHEYNQIKARELLSCTKDLIKDMEYLYSNLKKALAKEE